MKLKKWLGALFALVTVLAMSFGIAACDESEQTPPEEGNTVTVTWYDGRKVLREDEVEIGSKLTQWTPEKQGYEFLDWYSESSLTKKFDFESTTVEEETSIYSKWRSDTVATDDRIWYAIGSISGSNWKFVTQKNEDDEWEVVDGYEKFVFENKGGNTYELTLTLRPNCKFRFVTNLLDESTWEGDDGRAEMGLGNLKGFEYAEGKNPEGKGKVDCTAEDMEYGVVKDSQGNVVFHGGYEFNLPCNTWNIWPAEGSDGVYKFTVKTYPGTDEDNVLEWECVEKLDPLESQYDMYVVGTVTGDHENWHDDYEEAFKLERDPDNQKLWKAYVEVQSSMFPSWSAGENPDGVAAASIKIKNNVSGLDYGVAGESGTKGNGNVFLTAGTWCITYEEETDVVSYALCDYYVIGTMRFGNTNYNFVVADGRVTPNMTTKDGVTYKATIGVPDMRETEGFTWLKDKQTESGAPAIYALKAVYGSTIGVSEYYGVGTDGNSDLYLGETGTYEITLNVETKTLTATKTSDDVNVAEPVKVTYYNVTDTEVIKLYNEELIKGDKVTWKPERKRGFRFDGWYTDENCTAKYANGETGIQANMKLYGCYEEVDEEFDENKYYVTGSGQGDLATSGNFTGLRDKFELTKLPELDVNGLTVYETGNIKMYKGDQFKIVCDLTWANGSHFGFLELRDPGDVFCDEAGVGNIGIRRGQQGIYKFTFHSDPFDYTNSYIEWELVEPLEEKVTEDMYIVGNIKETNYNNWSTSVLNMVHMTLEEDGITWSAVIEIDLKDEFKIYNEINKSYHPGGTGNNISLKSEGYTQAGSYKISWNADTDQYTVAVAEAPAE